jgi:hypothetical protein
MTTETVPETATPAVARCSECGSRLAHDQRYCVECGTRRGALPAHAAALIGAIHEQGPAAALPRGASSGDSPADIDGRPPRAEFAMPGPRAAAVAVMCMLGFGVIVGSLVGGTPVTTLASAPLIVVGLNHSAQTSAAVRSPAVPDNGSAAANVAAAPASTSPALTQAAQAPASPITPATPTSAGTTSSPTGFGGLPPIKHVFLIVLSDRGFAHSFASSRTGGYLAGALRRQGELVQNYYAVAGAPLANEIALISGQGPTEQTASDCPVVSRIKPATKGPRGQVLGSGCVYPADAKTLAGQLAKAGHSWKAYLQGVSGKSASACHVPEPGSQVPQTGARAGVLAWHNPFVFFRSLTIGSACHKTVVGLGQLAGDLKSAGTTPSLSYIVPAPCNDGSEAPCKPNAPTGMAAANRFLKSVVPEIERSAAYKADGMIAVTFDQAPQTGADADPSSCCSAPSVFPNLRSLPSGTPAVPPAAMGIGTSTTSTTSTGTTGTTTTTGTDTTGTTTTTGTDTTTTGATTSPTDTSTTGTTSPTGTTTTPVDTSGGGISPTGGGGQVGLLLISQYVKPNSVDVIDYFNHFSLLASIEKLFGLHWLGYAGVPALPVFATAVFNQYAG